jgi:hypothetical protein
LPPLSANYPKLLIPEGMARAFVSPPKNPQSCLFAKMSVNYSADFKTHVEPCVFGGNPDCSNCGCSISSALHWIEDIKVAGPLRVGHLVNASLSIGSAWNRLRTNGQRLSRWQPGANFKREGSSLVQIQAPEQNEIV